MIHAVDHINLVVSNLERSVQFYTKLLGFKEIRRAHLEGDWIESVVGLKNIHADVVYVVAPAGEPRLELLCYTSPRGEILSINSLANTIGLRHIAFRVENIHTVARHLKEAGIKVISEPAAVPTSTVTHDAGHKILCYFLDPDGILLELAEYQ
ncbi:MAG: Glyoxalase family protein [Candidatus Jettenia ecosi]|uniref:Glyoxalase family protein n=1 Tax=Candidatus Jettenia ecosi TaxID=2494326 RepID=A0A533QR47_9BACT|nr:MAG: Glyoxalase family protein [Candidatus Jettenia ecosi]